MEDLGVDGTTIFKYIFKKNEMGGSCSTYGRNGGAYRDSWGRPEEMRLLGIPRRKWEYKIKMDLQGK